MATNKDKKWIWNVLDEIHFYDKKGEALLKAIVISISWWWGVSLPKYLWENTAENVIAASLFLYSISLIMEYTGKLISAYKFAPKIVPGLMVLISVGVLLFSGGTLFDRALTESDKHLHTCYILTCITQLVVWLDVLSQLFVESPNKIEMRLKNINLEKKDG